MSNLQSSIVSMLRRNADYNDRVGSTMGAGRNYYGYRSSGGCCDCPMSGYGYIGGSTIGGRMAKGIRHCVEKQMEPSGKVRCVKYAKGARGAGRPPKGVRHCINEVTGPSGKSRCRKYAKGPRGSGYIGGVNPGLAKYQEWKHKYSMEFHKQNGQRPSREELHMAWEHAKRLM